MTLFTIIRGDGKVVEVEIEENEPRSYNSDNGIHLREETAKILRDRLPGQWEIYLIDGMDDGSNI